MGIRSRRRSRSTAPPPPPSSSSMSSPWEEGRPSTRIRYAEQHRHHPRRPSSTPHSSDTPAFYGLTDDLIVEILSRVPAKSLSRFKCVSKHWLNLIGHPDHRKRLAQPLAGFFYNSNNQNRFPRTALHFFNASGSGRPLFYPSSSASISQTAAMASCSKILGCDKDAHSYLTGVYVYSSETRAWIYKQKGWDNDISLVEPQSGTIFVNSCLHFRTQYSRRDRARLAAVDTKGGTWSSFEAPCDVYSGYQCHGLIQRSHGRLNYLSLTIDDDIHCELYLEVYALEDYANKKWTLKHRIAVEEDANHNPFGGTTREYFDWIAIHPDLNLVYFVRGSEKTVSHYSIDCPRAWEIHTLGEGHPPYLPY
ncbi:hypothetical protein ACQ4PT_011042 [Festuca glaucescens]